MDHLLNQLLMQVYPQFFASASNDCVINDNMATPIEAVIRASVNALCSDGTDMRGDVQNPKSFQAPRM